MFCNSSEVGRQPFHYELYRASILHTVLCFAYAGDYACECSFHRRGLQEKNGEEEKYHANYLTRRLSILKTQILSLSVGKHLLVSYWGQNSSGGKFPQNPEKDLKDVCAERKYDIIVIGFVVTFFGKNNKGKYQ